MSDHRHEGEGFERSDLTAKAVLGFLGGVAIFLAVASVIVVGVYFVLNHYQRTHEPAQNPLVQASNADTRFPTSRDAGNFPQPRLEEVERQNLDQTRTKEEDILNSYGWVDEKAGIVRIPIERAMELVAQRGLPTRPPTADAKPAETTTTTKSTKNMRDGKKVAGR